MKNTVCNKLFKSACAAHFALAAVSLFAATETVAAIQVYACEISGITVYTSRQSPSCRAADLPKIGSYSGAGYETAVSRTAAKRSVQKNAKRNLGSLPKAKTNTPAAPVYAAPKNKPVVSSRRAILEGELQNERRALAEAQKLLNIAKSKPNGNPQQIGTLQNNVSDRQQNIQALRRELGRM